MNMSAFAIHGRFLVRLHDSDRFLQTCLSLIHKIQRNRNGLSLSLDRMVSCAMIRTVFNSLV